MSTLEAPDDSKFKKALAEKQAVPRINPEINQRLDQFIKSNPKLVAKVNEMPREYLERKYLLGKMEQQNKREAYNTRVGQWLNAPEQAELKKTLENTLLPKLSPRNAEATVLNQAKNYLRNSKIKLR